MRVLPPISGSEARPHRVRRAAAAAIVLVAALVGAPEAVAGLRFSECGRIGFQCARLSVPLDRSRAVAGRVSLYVKRLPPQRRPARGATFLLAGGPGQSATDAFSLANLDLFGPSFRRRALIVYDQRGTGRSGVLRCRAIQRTNSDDPGPAATCARRLGARRAFYTTRDSVADIEAIRRDLGVEKVTLVGTSYGTKVALGYALAYPTHVDRLVLDSVVEPGGPSAFDLDSLAAVPRVLTELCAPGARARDKGCASFAPDPVGDVRQLVAAMAGGPLRGNVIDARGRARPARVTRADLFGVLLDGDLDPTLRAAYPGAVRAALAGDRWPLMRLVRRSALAGRPPPARILSAGLFVATSCEETTFPWPRTTPPDAAERDRLAGAAAALLPGASFGPFDRATALDSELISLCGRWPESSADPVLAPGPLPDVPVLLLAGGQDLRTPLESAQRVAALFPHAALVTVPRAGHSVLGGDLSGCARRAFAAFFADRPVHGACRRGRDLFELVPPPPTSLDQVEPRPGVRGRAGRAVTALELALEDVAGGLLTQLISGSGGPARGGGLRGGSYRVTDRGLVLDRLVFVPGMRIGGTLRQGRHRVSRLRIGGPDVPHGLLTLRDGRLRGRLGATRVDVRFSATTAASARARAAAARLPAPPAPRSAHGAAR
jgi:pimeloyl-ACP methyl ester carboxylesterase